MSSNRKILVRTFLKEHNKFLNLENLTRQVNPGTIVKYYSRTAIVDIVDQNFLQKLAITPTPPQLTLFNHDYNVGKVNILENVIGTNHIHAEFSLKSSNSFALKTFKVDESFITPHDIETAMKKNDYNRESWETDYKGCAIVLRTISAAGLTYVAAKSSTFSFNINSKLILDGSSAGTVPKNELHVANPALNFSIVNSSSIGDNAIARPGTTPFFVLYTPRFDNETGKLKKVELYGN
jgi:hypothetical protein